MRCGDMHTSVIPATTTKYPILCSLPFFVEIPASPFHDTRNSNTRSHTYTHCCFALQLFSLYLHDRGQSLISSVLTSNTVQRYLIPRRSPCSFRFAPSQHSHLPDHLNRRLIPIAHGALGKRTRSSAYNLHNTYGDAKGNCPNTEDLQHYRVSIYGSNYISSFVLDINPRSPQRLPADKDSYYFLFWVSFYCSEANPPLHCLI
jgi:hypothetical protein